MKFLKNAGPMRPVFIILILVVVALVAKKVFAAIQAGAGAAGSLLGDQVLSQQTGIPASRITYLRKLADDAHAAIWGERKKPWTHPISFWFSEWDRIDENEGFFILAFNDCTTAQEAALASQFYKQIGGHSAKEDANKYLSASERKQITFLSSLT